MEVEDVDGDGTEVIDLDDDVEVIVIDDSAEDTDSETIDMEVEETEVVTLGSDDDDNFNDNNVNDDIINYNIVNDNDVTDANVNDDNANDDIVNDNNTNDANVNNDNVNDDNVNNDNVNNDNINDDNANDDNVNNDNVNDDNANNEIRIKLHELDPDAPDWPCFRTSTNFAKYTTGKHPPPIPLLIKECCRLIPIKNVRTGYVDWHPFNMPDIIIRRMTMVATIIQPKSNKTQLEFLAHDGTGIISVLFSRDRYENDLRKRMEHDVKYGISDKNSEKYANRMKKLAADMRKRGKIRPDQESFYLKHINWWRSAALGMKGKPLVVGDYVRMYGFIDVAGKSEIRHKLLLEHKATAPIVFKAYKIEAITEAQYNYTLGDWISNDIRSRYEPDVTPTN